MPSPTGCGSRPHILVVDLDACLADGLSGARLGGRPAFVQHVRSLASAVMPLADGLALLIIELCIPDGDAIGLIRLARNTCRPPIVIAVSATAERRQVAEAIIEGADAYLEKPVSGPELLRIYDRLIDAEDYCRRTARRLVGRIGLKQAQSCLRETMSFEALARTGGSRRAAAQLLGVDRRYVQRLAAACDEEEPTLSRTAAPDGTGARG